LGGEGMQPDDLDREFAAITGAERVGRRLKFLALVSVGAAILVGFFGVWRMQAASTQAQKAAERSAHARVYGELASPGTVSGGRLDGITVTDAKVVKSDGGHLYFTVVNSGPSDDLVEITAGAGSPPMEPVHLATGVPVRFAPGGRSYVIASVGSQPVHIVMRFRRAQPVSFDAPVSAG
jgi:hypothetical protein